MGYASEELRVKNYSPCSLFLLSPSFPNAQCPLALSEAVRVASRREGMPNARLLLSS